MNELKHIVSFSGGMGSFAEAKSCVDKYGKENVLLLFADTLMEDEDLYRFKNEVVEFLGCELVTLCYGKTPWELFEEQKFVANSRLDVCSRMLKRELLIKWVKDNYGYSPTPEGKLTHINAEIHLGIDFSEHHRLSRVQEVMSPWVYRSTLVEEGRIVPKDFSEQFGIRKPRLYEMGFGHNNCGGFCVKAGLGHYKILYEKLPERYHFHEETEQKLAAIYGTKPFLSKTINKVRSFITLKEYRETYLETGKAEEDKFDVGGCGCAI